MTGSAHGTLRVLALGVGAVEARAQSVPAGEEGDTVTRRGSEIVVPAGGGVALSVPGEDSQFLLTHIQWCGRVGGVGSLAILSVPVLERQSVAVASGDIGAPVARRGNDSKSDQSYDKDTACRHRKRSTMGRKWKPTVPNN